MTSKVQYPSADEANEVREDHEKLIASSDTGEGKTVTFTDPPTHDSGSEITGQAAESLKKSWGGYEGAISHLRRDLKDVESSLRDAARAWRAINSIRDDHNQSPLKPRELAEEVWVLQDLPSGIESMDRLDDDVRDFILNERGDQDDQDDGSVDQREWSLTESESQGHDRLTWSTGPETIVVHWMPSGGGTWKVVAETPHGRRQLKRTSSKEDAITYARDVMNEHPTGLPEGFVDE